MKGTIGLEFIGCNTADMLRAFADIQSLCGVKIRGDDAPARGPYVAAVTRSPSEDLTLSPVWGKRDYSKANSKGSRGVYVWYTLEMDVLYYVREPKSWRSVAEYYVAVTQSGRIYKLSDEEVEEWLSGL